jgi:hypothetical protein
VNPIKRPSNDVTAAPRRGFRARAALSRRGAILAVAFSFTSDHAAIKNPYGSYPGFVSLMRKGFNISVDNHPLEGRLEGFWIRLRYAFLDVDGDADPAHDLRVILNYQIPIF